MHSRKTAEKLDRGIRIIDLAVKNLLLIAIVLITVFVLFILYENVQILRHADSAQYAKYKPTAEDQYSFEELKEINPDVIGWLTIEDTDIDYPLLQAGDNDKYINTDVMGEFSLTGSIFLDYRCQPDFSDTVSIIYGHDMEADKMFGGFYQYKEADYFQKHLRGTIYHDGEYERLDIFAFLETSGYNGTVYDLSVGPDRLTAWLEGLRPLFLRSTGSLPTSGRVVLMSSCEAGVTDGRLVLAAQISKGGEAPAKKPQQKRPGLELPDPDQIPWWGYLLTSVILGWWTIVYVRKKKIF